MEKTKHTSDSKVSSKKHSPSHTRMLIFASSIIVLGAVYYFYSANSMADKNITKKTIVGIEKVIDKKTDKNRKIETNEEKNSNKYIAYDVQAVNTSLGEGKKVVLFFYASWCPSCRSLDKEIKEGITSIPENTIIYKVNYDNANSLKQKYGVTSQHTIVFIDKDMNMLDKMTGGDFDKILPKL